MSNIGNVWVFVEQEGGKIADVSLELVSKGAELAAKLNVKLEAVLLGNHVEQCCATLFSYGCNKVFLAEDPRLEPFTVLPYAKVIMDLIREWTAADVEADLKRCGKAGSPTNVKQIMSVVLTAGDFKKIEPTESGVSDLVHELIEDHTLG